MEGGGTFWKVIEHSGTNGSTGEGSKGEQREERERVRTKTYERGKRGCGRVRKEKVSVRILAAMIVT